MKLERASMHSVYTHKRKSGRTHTKMLITHTAQGKDSGAARSGCSMLSAGPSLSPSPTLPYSVSPLSSVHLWREGGVGVVERSRYYSLLCVYASLKVFTTAVLFGLVNTNSSCSMSWKESRVEGTNTSALVFIFFFARKNQIRHQDSVIKSRSVGSLESLVL